MLPKLDKIGILPKLEEPKAAPKVAAKPQKEESLLYRVKNDPHQGLRRKLTVPRVGLSGEIIEVDGQESDKPELAIPDLDDLNLLAEMDKYLK